MKTEIFCDVTSCKFQKDQHCNAKTITVCCDNCIHAKNVHETACSSFESKN
ncbi:DUF1540 domain-containing protein [Merdibacter massiliensis]|uniref:DUF1540 domain-containing protein n=1 Tax=Merdibacter massiliensis TaxID=1871030 RepID=UPI00096A64C0|nr:DUF1540 domain-containing protein [Merdibacter massiliensis]